MLKKISEANEWICFACDEDSLRIFRALHWALKNSIKKKEQTFNTSVPSSFLLSETSAHSNTSPNLSCQTKEQKSEARPDTQVTRPDLPSAPSTAPKYPSISSRNRFSPYEALPSSSFSFTTKGDQTIISATQYPETPHGIEKRNLELKCADTLELSQLLRNKIKSMTTTSAFKHAQTNSQIEEQLQRVDLIVDLFIEKAQTLKSRIASNIKIISERCKNVSEEDDENPIFQEVSHEMIDLSSDDEDERN